MAIKPTYEELEQRVRELEQEAVKHDQVAKNLVEIKTLLNNVLYHSGVDAVIVTDMDMCIMLYNQTNIAKGYGRKTTVDYIRMLYISYGFCL